MYLQGTGRWGQSEWLRWEQPNAPAATWYRTCTPWWRCGATRPPRCLCSRRNKSKIWRSRVTVKIMRVICKILRRFTSRISLCFFWDFRAITLPFQPKLANACLFLSELISVSWQKNNILGYLWSMIRVDDCFPYHKRWDSRTMLTACTW